ncbi:MAG: glycosyltransferase family 4 protein [Victivallaceae bacterium]
MQAAQVIRRLSFDEWGGTETVVWNNSRNLPHFGVESEILATSALSRPGEEKVDGQSIRRFPYLYPYFPMTAIRRAALDKKGGNPWVPKLERYLLKQNFDLIHCHNLGRILELTRRVAEKKRIPYVVSLHGGCTDVPAAEKEELLRPIRGTFSFGGAFERLFRVRRDALERADGIICVGENELAALKAQYPDKKVLFLPNGVTPEKYRAETFFDWRGHLGIAPDTELILDVSRIDYQKNQLLLIDYAALLKKRGRKFHLLLIGPVTSEWYGWKINEKIAAEKLGDCVTVIAGLHPDDPRLTGAYRSADLFILPSKHEPFGIVVLEAWSAGVPVVGARVGGLAKLIRDSENGMLFESESLDALDAACEKMRGCRDAIRAAAGREVSEKYDWNVVAGQLKAFYEEVSR